MASDSAAEARNLRRRRRRSRCRAFRVHASRYARMEAPLAISEKPVHQDRDSEHSYTPLPAVQHRAFAGHWLAIDDGGAELMTVTFGTPARQAPRRIEPAAPPHDRSTIRPAPPPRQHIAPDPSRLRATVAVLLIILAILLVAPLARPGARALAVSSEAEAEAGAATAMSAAREAQALVIHARRMATRAPGP